MPTPHAPPISLSGQQRQDLLRLARAHSAPQALVRRARIVLRAADADGPANLQVAEELGCKNDTVGRWRRRFAERGLGGLLDAPRSGRPPVFSPRRQAPRHRAGHRG
ncbi:MAG: helix-turn-helix domain-containing protein [Gemmataceae bacterium]|nr:helix-turn-helix domain-containing protein [Gemmataceae bacterium]